MSDWFNAVGFWTEPWSQQLFQASWQGALVLAVVLSIARWWTFLSPRVICWILRLACLKLLVALFWVRPVSLPLLLPTPGIAASHEAVLHDAITAQNDQQASLPVESPHFVGQNIPQPSAETNRISRLSLLPLFWLVGICFLATITAGRWFSVRRLCRETEPNRSVGLCDVLRQEAERLGIRGVPSIRFSSQADSPFLAGIGRPAIILPDRAEESLDESELRLVLAHELAHVKRHDLQWNWLPTIVGWLFWFHPLVWLMKRRWCEAQEAACDEMLIQNHVARPAEYGRLLLKLAAGWPQLSGAGPIAVGMFGSYHNLERRILTMPRVRAFSLRRLVIAAVILSLVAVPGLIPWRLVAQEPDRAAQPVVNSPTTSALMQPAGDLQPERDAAAAKSLRSKTQDPKFLEAAGRGLAAFEKRDFAQALVDFEEAIRLAPNHSEARRWRGDALLNQGEVDKALSAYEDAIRLDPKNAMAYVSRGMAWVGKREPGPALIAFETAVALDPHQARRPLVKRYVAAAQFLLTSGSIAGFGHPEKEKSPFAAVRWQDSQPEVRLGEEWFKLVSLNGIPASKIVAFSRRNFGNRWKMRFEEDLVELLTRMGHPPKDTATLVVEPLAPSEARTLKDVPMTAANRWAIKAAADARKASEP
jgi:beta-lactamase regulating signal transducer with metallopeptidase domain